MLIDDVTIRVRAGAGGKGASAFNKNLLSLGPAGGSGGAGGSVWFEGSSDLSLLNHFRFKKEVVAEDGGDGRGQFVDGKTGKDHLVRVPIGTVVHNLTTGEDREIVKIGERVEVAHGGKGGKGNFHFRSSTNTSPREFQRGLPGEECTLRLELKLIADVGLIGLPNAGKSSLLNELTRAKAKVANYPFTTLEPNLGAYYELILADIPGLIEGASQGKGLGVRFLRHIERTRVLFHLVPADEPDPARNYRIVRAEIKAHNPALLERPEYVFLSKSDTVDGKELKQKLAELKKLNPNATPLSVLDDESIAHVKKFLADIEKQKEL
ncbi:MAG: GTPase ObgE [Patescibacteria group bacterium]